MKECCDRENCWEPATSELTDPRGDVVGLFCDHHAQAKIEHSHYRIEVRSLKPEAEPKRD